MPGLRITTGLMFVFLLATLGAVLLFVPPWIMEQYARVEKLGILWVYGYFAVVGTGAALLGASTGWTAWRLWSASRRKQQRQEIRSKNPSELSHVQREQEINTNLADVEKLKVDPALSEEIRRAMDPLVNQLTEKRASQKLEIVAFGTISSGKSSLLNALAGQDVFQSELKGGTTVTRNEIDWPGAERVVLVDTPGLGEVDGEERAAISAAAAKDSDLVLLVVDGPLRNSEYRLLERLGAMEKRVLVCLTKEDWYDASERKSLLGQISEQVHSFIPAEDVVAVQSQSVYRQRVRVLPNGEETEERIAVPPDISPLADRMLHVVRRDGRELLLANLLLQSRGLVNEARRRVTDALDRRAREIVEKHTWMAGGAAALSPTPVLDVMVGSVITAKMVVEVSRVYHQDMDLQAATELLAQLGKNLLAVVGTAAATPAVASGVASLLKSIPGAGTIAGGVLQGIVQSLVTRWIGAVFIEYFKNESRQSAAGLAELAREQWQKLTTVDELRQFLQAARGKLFKAPDE